MERLPRDDGGPEVNPVRVVVVEDNEAIRFVLRLALERNPDFELVAEAVDGQQAWTLWPRTSRT